MNWVLGFGVLGFGVLGFGVLGFIAGPVQAPPTRTIELSAQTPLAVTVEQLRIGTDGAVEVVDTRALTVAPVAAFSYEPGPHRYVRFRYEGMSPRTYSTTELNRLERIRAPDPLPGGELLLVVPSAIVRPEAFDVAGPRTQRVPVTDTPSVSLAGVPPGQYRMTPIYAGGVRGTARTARVEAAASTVSYITTEAVGAADVVADADVCSRATAVTIDLLVAAPAPLTGADPAPPRRAPLVQLEPRCQLFVAGLLPGTYDVSYRAREAVLGRASLTIAPQQVSQLTVTAAAIGVSGRVTLNGRPIANAALSFRFNGSAEAPAGAQVPAQTDTAGFYRAMLPARGPYSITFPPGDVIYSVHEQATFDRATNTLDIALAGGTIAVSVDGWDGHSAVEIRIEGQRGQHYARWAGRRRVFATLPFGEHVVTLVAGGQTGESRTVVLTVARPEADLRFNIRRP